MRLSVLHRHPLVRMAGGWLLLVTLGLGAAAPVTASPGRITGQLSRPGYTVMALSASGRATSVRVKGTSFALRPPAASVTLHLRAPGGAYAGPVVVGRAASRAIVGVRAGARLGRIIIRRGYATPRRRLAARWVDVSRTARAKAGVPLGAGKVGLVRVTLPRHGGPGDRDLDGVPNALDIDDDGDLILDGYDRPAKLRTSARPAPTGWAAAFPDGTRFDVNTMFGWTPYGAVNANGGSTDAELSAAQVSGGVMAVFWDEIDPATGELDCGTLSYCAKGGTGLWRKTNEPPDWSDPRAGRPAFPDCCDADGDGLGSLKPDKIAAGLSERGGGMFLLPGATADQLRAEDVLIARGTRTEPRSSTPPRSASCSPASRLSPPTTTARATRRRSPTRRPRRAGPRASPPARSTPAVSRCAPVRTAMSW